ncbi:MAG: MotA/TolQ/ExbB proton channel family protein [Rubritalea sp.]|uniref:MotA/TolQ/ExbB proton channel family protein n=1 Tax=Rubritalea sp. TaxID=2109375 RepID=UPI0032424CAD
MYSISIIYKECATVLEQGGVVLWMILAVGVWLYALLFSSWCTVGPLRSLIQTCEIAVGSSCKREVVRDYAVFELDHLSWVERRLPVIAVMIASCSLGGLLGTVSGMLATFTNMASNSQINPMEKIAAGISEAMITTQAGLLIALPAAFIFALLRSRVGEVQMSLSERQQQTLVKLANKKELV